MGFFDAKIALDRMDKASKEFENLLKPTEHISKLDIVNSFRK